MSKDKLNILILEDNIHRINKFKSKLESYDLYITEDAKEAIEFIKKFEFDYIFLDHDLGGKEMDWDDENCGMVVAKHINENGVLGNPKIYVHSLNFPRAVEMTKLIEGSVYKPYLWDLIK